MFQNIEKITLNSGKTYWTKGEVLQGDGTVRPMTRAEGQAWEDEQNLQILHKPYSAYPELRDAIEDLHQAIKWQPSEDELNQQQHDIQVASTAAAKFGEFCEIVDILFPQNFETSSTISFSQLCYTEETVDVNYGLGVRDGLDFDHAELTWYIRLQKNYRSNAKIIIIAARKLLSNAVNDGNVFYNSYIIDSKEIDGKNTYFFPLLPAKKLIFIAKYLPRFIEMFTEGIKKRREHYS